MNKTVLMMAAGTGGHIFPALAVADELRAQGWKIVWLGTALGMESQLVPKRGYPVECVAMQGVRGKGIVRKLLAPWVLLKASLQCRAIVQRVRPQLVVGFGGYVTVPGGLAARFAGVPLIIHEQNSIAGMSNRLLAKIAQKVLTAFPSAFPLGGKVQLLGNPVREEITKLEGPTQRYYPRMGPLRILVVGGSLGAQVLNQVVPQALALLPEAQRPLVTHQAGQKHLADLQACYHAAGVKADTVAFIDDMAQAYAQADLVICRAGALTVAEVCAAGVAALFVPYPFAVDDHQTGNARYLVDGGAALMQAQAHLTPATLAETLSRLSRNDLRQLAEKAHALAQTQATQAVAACCSDLAKEN